jgi:hypothetical protein
MEWDFCVLYLYGEDIRFQLSCLVVNVYILATLKENILYSFFMQDWKKN